VCSTASPAAGGRGVAEPDRHPPLKDDASFLELCCIWRTMFRSAGSSIDGLGLFLLLRRVPSCGRSPASAGRTIPNPSTPEANEAASDLLKFEDSLLDHRRSFCVMRILTSTAASYVLLTATMRMARKASVMVTPTICAHTAPHRRTRVTDGKTRHSLFCLVCTPVMDCLSSISFGHLSRHILPTTTQTRGSAAAQQSGPRFAGRAAYEPRCR
jgi:hypothetical protein